MGWVGPVLGTKLTLPAVCWDVGHDNVAFGLECGGWPTFWDGAMATAEFCSGHMAPDAQKWLGFRLSHPLLSLPSPPPVWPFSGVPDALEARLPLFSLNKPPVKCLGLCKKLPGPWFCRPKPWPRAPLLCQPSGVSPSPDCAGTLQSHPWPGPCPQAYCALQGLVAPPLSPGIPAYPSGGQGSRGRGLPDPLQGYDRRHQATKEPLVPQNLGPGQLCLQRDTVFCPTRGHSPPKSVDSFSDYVSLLQVWLP